MSCHCACLKGNEIKVIMTPGGAAAQDIHLNNAYLEGNVLVLEMNNGRVFRVDLSGISPQPVETIEFLTKNDEIFMTIDNEVFTLKEEGE